METISKLEFALLLNLSIYTNDSWKDREDIVATNKKMKSEHYGIHFYPRENNVYKIFEKLIKKGMVETTKIETDKKRGKKRVWRIRQDARARALLLAAFLDYQNSNISDFQERMEFIKFWENYSPIARQQPKHIPLNTSSKQVKELINEYNILQARVKTLRNLLTHVYKVPPIQLITEKSRKSKT